MPAGRTTIFGSSCLRPRARLRRRFDITTSPRANAVERRAKFLKGKSFSASGWWDVFWNNPKPIIAQIQGFCIAGGLATATFCDLRICSEDAKFGAPEIRTGGPYIPAIWQWVVGMTKARELLYTGNLIDAEEAKRLDLVNKVVPVEELDAAVERQAATIAKLPAATVEYNKKLISTSYEMMGVRRRAVLELEAIALASHGRHPRSMSSIRSVRKTVLRRPSAGTRNGSSTKTPGSRNRASGLVRQSDIVFRELHHRSF